MNAYKTLTFHTAERFAVACYETSSLRLVFWNDDERSTNSIDVRKATWKTQDDAERSARKLNKLDPSCSYFVVDVNMSR